MTSNNDNRLEKDGRINITPKLASDSVELAEVYVAYMRAHDDFDTIPNMLNRFNDQLFADDGMAIDQLRQLAVYATDKIYRIAAELEIRDAYTATYFKKVIAQLMKSLQSKGVEIFYVIDNEIRQDRFELAVLLYEWSGITVVSPYTNDGALSFEEVEKRLKTLMDHGRSIVYIEKDASVNYIQKVVDIACDPTYIRLFRNHGASDHNIKVL